MKHPIVVGFLSIIPGLGLLVFQRYRQAIYTFLFVDGIFLFSFFSPWAEISLFAFLIASAFWIYQISMAVRLAQAIKSQGGDFLSNRFEQIEIPSGLSRREKNTFKMKETLKQFLEFDEKLLEAIYATRGKYGGSYYLGKSDKNLIIVELDFFSKPLYVKRIDLTAINRVIHKSGILTDTVVFFSKKCPKNKI